ncbi:MAG: DUF2339 domain-containing protein [Acidobacteria bacterium]|nr:DUF2339 domain-containing protein [Acidobacteriota bacterium]MBV9477471.1 DUF2339 domain-containing protein [Acidobacteriota bacterium]
MIAVIALVVVLRLRRAIAELRAFIALTRGAPEPPSVAPPVAATAAPPPAAAVEPEPRPAAPPPPPPAAQPEIPIYTPPAPRPSAAPQVPPSIATNNAWAIDWENLVGIKLFSWIAGIALVLAAVFLFKYSVEHGWLRPAIRAGFGLVTGIVLLVVCELRVARDYRFTANALDGAGIAILYATLYALHARWHLWPGGVVFVGMLLVTAAAVFLSTRRDSVFVALLGLLGGFATPALLSTGENRPIELFSYLLLLNGGISWIAWRKRWPLLTGISVVLTVIYQWGWISRFLDASQLPLAAAIFVAFAIVAATSFFTRGEDGERTAVFRRIAAAGAVLPLLFAFFTAIVPAYGARFNVLFGFLMLVTAGLAAIAAWRGPTWLHDLGALATLLTFFIWLTVSYTAASWPWSLLWLAGFIALYLVTGVRVRSVATLAAGFLFFVFVGLAFRETSHATTLAGAMFALLAIVYLASLLMRQYALLVPAIAFSAIAVLALDNLSFGASLAAHTVLFTAAFALAWIADWSWIALAAIPFYACAIGFAPTHGNVEPLVFAAAIYALFLAYPLLLGARVKRSPFPHLAAVLASLILAVRAYYALEKLGYDDVIGLLPLGVAALLVLLLWRLLRDEPSVVSRTAFVAGSALAFITAAVPLQLSNEWITIAWALEGTALAWLFQRIPHRGLLVWSGGLFAAVVARLLLNPAVLDYHAKSATPIVNWYLYTYLVCAIAMYAGARFFDAHAARGAIAAGATALLFALVNIEVADWYSTGDTLTFNFFSSTLAQDLTYTFAWTLFAIAMLVIGIAFRVRGARVAALGLLLVTILKCFLHDLARLGGLYRVASLFGLAVSLVLVGVLLQRFVMMRSASETSGAPTGTT